MLIDTKKNQIIKNVIDHAIWGMGLGSQDGKAARYLEILETFKKNHGHSYCFSSRIIAANGRSE